MPPISIQQAVELAVQLHCAGKWSEAEALYLQILASQPGNVVVQSNLGELYRGTGRFPEAVAAYRRAIECNAGIAEIHNNLGNALQQLGQIEEAIASYRWAIELKPGFSDAHNNLGAALLALRQPVEAASACRRAVELKPDFSPAYNNLGTALFEMGAYDEAVGVYRRALEFDANIPEVHKNLGEALLELGRFDEAERCFCRALELNPAYAGGKFGYSLLLLLRGDFERGWPMYEARREAMPFNRRDFSQPMWDGNSLHGKRVLVHAEQGFGDAIQFARYATLVAERGGEVLAECPRELVALFRGVQGVHEVIAYGDSLPPFDLHAPMLSLPMLFHTRRETIPSEVPYLVADPARRETWRQRLGHNRAALKVGLVWASNPGHRLAGKRDIPFDSLSPLLGRQGVEFFSLRAETGAEEMRQRASAAGIIDYTEHIHDFADTAAFMAELDVIISVDTAAAHLAGALGRPTWTLLPRVADWRWGQEGEATPWYPTMRLFRQSQAGEWSDVIRRVGEKMVALSEA